MARVPCHAVPVLFTVRGGVLLRRGRCVIYGLKNGASLLRRDGLPCLRFFGVPRQTAATQRIFLHRSVYVLRGRFAMKKGAWYKGVFVVYRHALFQYGHCGAYTTGVGTVPARISLQ